MTGLIVKDVSFDANANLERPSPVLNRSFIAMLRLLECRDARIVPFRVRICVDDCSIIEEIRLAGSLINALRIIYPPVETSYTKEESLLQ